MDFGIEEIEKELMEKEEALDKILNKKREVVRLCSNAIKSIHGKDMDQAKKYVKEAEKEINSLRKVDPDLAFHINHVLQEYVEAKVTISVVEEKLVPPYKDFDVPIESYLNGLLDATGEIKREMYESLRKGKKKDAEVYFEIMEKIYDALLPLKFSNAVLPEFRRKQDVARIQIEQARGELL
ncbi:RNA-binding protein [Candidatus Micrarchaeota archaeon]|nr:RNA-binding protein [Candidatus Micrarchaeota archaeon]